MRREPSTDSAILAVLGKGEPLKALGYSYTTATIGDEYSPWVLVECKKITGWLSASSSKQNLSDRDFWSLCGLLGSGDGEFAAMAARAR
jgi:hypothetical protein